SRSSGAPACTPCGCATPGRRPAPGSPVCPPTTTTPPGSSTSPPSPTPRPAPPRSGPPRRASPRPLPPSVKSSSPGTAWSTGSSRSAPPGGGPCSSPTRRRDGRPRPGASSRWAVTPPPAGPRSTSTGRRTCRTRSPTTAPAPGRSRATTCRSPSPPATGHRPAGPACPGRTRPPGSPQGSRPDATTTAGGSPPSSSPAVRRGSAHGHGVGAVDGGEARRPARVLRAPQGRGDLGADERDDLLREAAEQVVLPLDVEHVVEGEGLQVVPVGGVVVEDLLGDPLR